MQAFRNFGIIKIGIFTAAMFIWILSGNIIADPRPWDTEYGHFPQFPHGPTESSAHPAIPFSAVRIPMSKTTTHDSTAKNHQRCTSADRSGNLRTVYHTEADQGYEIVHLTFNPRTKLQEETYLGQGMFPSLYVDSDDISHVTWLDRGAVYYCSFIRNLITPPRKVNTFNDNCEAPGVVVDFEGNVWAVWSQRDPYGTGNCRIYLSDLHNRVIRPISPVTQDAHEPSPALGSGGLPCVAWRDRNTEEIYFTRMISPDSYTWSVPQCLVSDFTATESPCLHARGGNYCLVFCGSDNLFQEINRIYYVESTGGNTWSEPLRISHPMQDLDDSILGHPTVFSYMRNNEWYLLAAWMDAYGETESAVFSARKSLTNDEWEYLGPVSSTDPPVASYYPSSPWTASFYLVWTQETSGGRDYRLIEFEFEDE